MKSYMKLLVSLLVAVALLTGLFALPQTALAASAVYRQSNSVLGDASGDGKINLKDAIMTLQFSNGKEVAIDSGAADVSGDGKVNLKDAILILKRANGNKDPFPGESTTEKDDDMIDGDVGVEDSDF